MVYIMMKIETFPSGEVFFSYLDFDFRYNKRIVRKG